MEEFRNTINLFMQKDKFKISCEPIKSCYCTKDQLHQLKQHFINEHKSYNDIVLLNKKSLQNERRKDNTLKTCCKNWEIYNKETQINS